MSTITADVRHAAAAYLRRKASNEDLGGSPASAAVYRQIADEVEHATLGDQQTVPQLIAAECDGIREMLLAKNRAYGNSALDPLRVFSRASTEEQIRVRLDDKLSRLKRGQGVETEDVEADIIGYLVLLRVHRRLAAPALAAAPSSPSSTGGAT